MPWTEDYATWIPPKRTLKEVPAQEYWPLLSGRRDEQGVGIRCPFHGEGLEKNPSIRPDGALWVCANCPRNPETGKRFGGDIYVQAGKLWGLPLPLRGEDFIVVGRQLETLLAIVPEMRTF